MQMTDSEAKIIGQKLVEFLGLQPMKKTDKYPQDRYDTTWGWKTLEGLGRCLERLTKG